MMRVVAVGSSGVVVGIVAVNLFIIFIYIVSSCNMIRCDPERDGCVALFSPAVSAHNHRGNLSSQGNLLLYTD